MGGFTSSIGDLFGGAQNNAGFTAAGTNIAQPTTMDQAQGAYGTAQSGLTQQQQLVNALSAQNGIQNQSNVFNQLQGVANGTGPNPAMAQLQQTTGQNVANQAALMAGQRGASANPALLARQAAQQGAATQQQAVGQGATLAAQQQLGALGQLGGLATQQVGQQQNAVGQLNSAAQNEQNQLLNSINSQNNANVSLVSNQNNANENMASTNAQDTMKTIGAIASAAGAGASPKAGGGGGGATGGEVKKDQIGDNPKLKNVPGTDRFPAALYPSHLKDMGSFYHGNNFKMGGKVPGEAKMPGDHPENDTVPAKLSPGEFVIPKSVMESEDPAAGAAKMIADYQKKNGNQHKMQGDFKSALQRAIKERKNK